MENRTMLNDTQKSYFEDRWQSQANYFGKKATRSKKWHRGLQIFVTISAVSVPLLLSFPEVPSMIPAIISGLVALATTTENVFRFGENWRTARQVEEVLKREKALFDACSGIYKSRETSFTRFVERCEIVIAEDIRRFSRIEDENDPGSQVVRNFE